MKRKILLIMGLLCLTLSAFSATYIVEVEDFEFDPAFLTVNVGDTIIWMWDEGSHTTTSTNIPAGATAWDSPITGTSPVFMYVPSVAGSYNYVCSPHASMGMQGLITVNGTTGIQQNSVELGSDARVINGELLFSFTLKKQAMVNIDLLLPDGRIIRRLSADVMPAGEYRPAYNLGGLQSGIYLLRVEGDRQKMIKRVFVN